MEPGAPRFPASPMARRTFLMLAAGSSVGLLASCGSASTTPAADSADDLLRTQVAAAELALIAQYQEVIAAFPDLGASLIALQEQHRAHLVAMAPAGAPGDDASASAATAPAPGSARQALELLADAERAASQQRREACLGAADPDLARTLALIAASEASHVPALGQVPV